MVALLGLAQSGWAQNGWEPTRIPANSSARPLPAARQTVADTARSAYQRPTVSRVAQNVNADGFDQSPEHFQPARRIDEPEPSRSVAGQLPVQGRNRQIQAPSTGNSELVASHVSQRQPVESSPNDSGSVLRWTSAKPESTQPETRVASATVQAEAFDGSQSESELASPSVQYAFQDGRATQSFAEERGAAPAPPTRSILANEQQGRQAVRQANYQYAYQQDSTSDPFSDNFGLPPELPQGGNQGVPPENSYSTPPSLELPQLNQGEDTLSAPEIAPPPAQDPPSASDGANDYPFENAYSGQGEGQDTLPTPGAGDDEDEQNLDLPDPNQGISVSCDDRRDRIRGLPINRVSLDTSPAFGRGLSSRDEIEDMRLQFADSAPVRDWRNTRGELIASGKLIDVREERVLLDVNGSRKFIWLQELSDVDSAYVGEAWNIPLQCGVGSETYAGRNFIPSTVQFTAPGQCHKPLYFEQTQLERYGHEIGPVLQPMLSTAHFFTNIAVLPYKMGIHPPNECQYSLGYYRPGNCAPYMMQPIPISLRGAVAQAGVSGFAAAFIP